ncbi:MAG: hypothetical protein AAGA85_16770 [Bacteroidota bacterium]
MKIIPGVGTGLWLVIFLVFIAPFDLAGLSFSIRVLITVVYGLIFFIIYLLVIALEPQLQKRALPFWAHEIIVYLFVYLTVFPPTLLYYESDIVNGDYERFRFLTEQYFPILVVVTPVLFGFRRMIALSRSKATISLRGDNKRDVLQIVPDQLVCIVSSDNYIEVNFLENGILQKKLLRTTLSKTEKGFPFLKRVHRSCLINPEHFTEWVNKDSILVGGVQVSVTKKYRGNIPC